MTVVVVVRDRRSESIDRFDDGSIRSSASSVANPDESRLKKNTGSGSGRVESHAPRGGAVEVLWTRAARHPDVTRRGAGRRRHRRSRGGRRDVDGARERACRGEHFKRCGAGGGSDRIVRSNGGSPNRPDPNLTTRSRFRLGQKCVYYTVNPMSDTYRIVTGFRYTYRYNFDIHFRENHDARTPARDVRNVDIHPFVGEPGGWVRLT